VEPSLENGKGDKREGHTRGKGGFEVTTCVAVAFIYYVFTNSIYNINTLKLSKKT
jgi:hypothetical protein